MEKVKFNYMVLKDKIDQNFKNRSEFAKQLGITYTELSYKLNNKSAFTQNQIALCIKLLGLSSADVHDCFFMLR